MAAVLIATGLMKLSVLLAEEPVLARPNPLFFFVPNRFVLVVAGALEIWVGITALKLARRALFLAIGLQGGLLAMFVSYRAGLVIVGTGQPCGCFGVFNRLLYQGTGFDPAKALLIALCLALAAAWWLQRGQDTTFTRGQAVEEGEVA